MDFTTILAGVGAGITFGLSGFAKNRGDAFDWLKFGRTVLIGAATGVVASLYGVQLEVAQTYFIELGIVPVVENGLKTIYRYLKGE